MLAGMRALRRSGCVVAPLHRALCVPRRSPIGGFVRRLITQPVTALPSVSRAPAPSALRALSTATSSASSSAPAASAIPPSPTLLAAPPPYRVLLFASGEFALPALEALAAEWKRPADASDRLISHLELVCGADKARPKPNAKPSAERPKAITKARAEALGVRVHQLPASLDMRMTGWAGVPRAGDGAGSEPAFDLGVIVSFGYFLPPAVIAHGFRCGMLNVHPALLPRYRGASPVQSALWADERESGVTVTAVHPTAFDHGAVIDQHTVPIEPFATFGSFAPRMADACAARILHVLRRYQTLAPQLKPQPPLTLPAAVRAQPTATPLPSAAALSPTVRAIAERARAPRLPKSEASLSFSAHSADALWRRYAALHGYFPLHTSFRGERLIVHELTHPATLQPAVPSAAATPGHIEYDAAQQVLWVTCGPHDVGPAPQRTPRIASNRLAVRRLQIATKRPMSAAEFANGYLRPKRNASVESVFS